MKKAIDSAVNFIDKNRLFSFVFGLLIFFLFLTNFTNLGDQQFLFLARSFLHGKTYFIDDLENWADTSFYQGNYYWPLGPFSAILMTPFVYLFGLFGDYFLQGYINFVLAVCTFLLVFKISRKIGFSEKDSLLWALTYLLGSAFIAVAALPWSWYFSHSVVTFLLFWAIYEHFSKKRYWAIGTVFSLILATRPTAWLGIIFFALTIIIDKRKYGKVVQKELFQLVFPNIVSLFLLMAYNKTRFGNIFEMGYSYQLLTKSVMERRNIGLFSLRHVPANLYFLLINTPAAVYGSVKLILVFPFIKSSDFGMSIFLTSPYVLYLFSLKRWEKLSKYLLITIAVIMIPIVSYYGIGAKQYGYRYSLDFLPFLYLLVMINYKKTSGALSKNFRLLLWFSILINTYLFLGTIII